MYLVKQLTQASLPEIGRQFGGKHHTTVLHSINKIDALRRSDTLILGFYTISSDSAEPTLELSRTGFSLSALTFLEPDELPECYHRRRKWNAI